MFIEIEAKKAGSALVHEKLLSRKEIESNVDKAIVCTTGQLALLLMLPPGGTEERTP